MTACDLPMHVLQNPAVAAIYNQLLYYCSQGSALSFTTTGALAMHISLLLESTYAN